MVFEDGELRTLPSGRPDARMMIFPAEDVDLIDTWHVMGLKGTGSGDIKVENVRVPKGRSVSLVADKPVIEGALFKFPAFGLLSLGVAATAMGNAKGALQAFADLAGAKKNQGSKKTLSERATIHDWLWQFCPDQSTGWVRHRLAEVLFVDDDVFKLLGALSGGEAARVIFSKLSVLQPNVLVLDEPTNHLDLEGIEALAQGLKSYDGTIIFVSHDRWFVGQLATRVFEITLEGVDDYVGDYARFMEHKDIDHLQR